MNAFAVPDQQVYTLFGAGALHCYEWRWSLASDVPAVMPIFSDSRKGRAVCASTISCYSLRGIATISTTHSASILRSFIDRTLNTVYEPDSLINCGIITSLPRIFTNNKFLPGAFSSVPWRFEPFFAHLTFAVGPECIISWACWVLACLLSCYVWNMVIGTHLALTNFWDYFSGIFAYWLIAALAVQSGSSVMFTYNASTFLSNLFEITTRRFNTPFTITRGSCIWLALAAGAISSELFLFIVIAKVWSTVDSMRLITIIQICLSSGIEFTILTFTVPVQSLSIWTLFCSAFSNRDTPFINWTVDAPSIFISNLVRLTVKVAASLLCWFCATQNYHIVGTCFTVAILQSQLHIRVASSSTITILSLSSSIFRAIITDTTSLKLLPRPTRNLPTDCWHFPIYTLYHWF